MHRVASWCNTDWRHRTSTAATASNGLARARAGGHGDLAGAGDEQRGVGHGHAGAAERGASGNSQNPQNPSFCYSKRSGSVAWSVKIDSIRGSTALFLTFNSW